MVGFQVTQEEPPDQAATAVVTTGTTSITQEATPTTATGATDVSTGTGAATISAAKGSTSNEKHRDKRQRTDGEGSSDVDEVR